MVWNPKSTLVWNPESRRLESGIQRVEIQNPDAGIRNLEAGIRNPGPSWILLPRASRSRNRNNVKPWCRIITCSLGPCEKQMQLHNRGCQCFADSGSSWLGFPFQIYGCAPATSNERDFTPVDGQDDDVFAVGLLFAPKDVEVVTFTPKDDLHGIGYKGIDPTTALSTQQDWLGMDPVRGRTGKMGIRGQVSVLF